MRHLSALAEVHAALAEAGFSLIAISPDRPEKLRARPETAATPFLLLSDSEAQAARAFGIAFKVEDTLVAKYKESYGIDLEGDSGQTHHLLPHPAVFVADARGIIRFAHVNPDYKVRLTSEEIMRAAKRALATDR
jgi:peroxiredoxin